MADDEAKILIADDEPRNLLALQAILDVLGQPIVAAGSGDEVLRHLSNDEFAVLVLDVRMPNMSGIEAARLIRSRTNRHTPIIFLSAVDATYEDILKGYEVGAIDYITKPFLPDLLRYKVAAFVDLFRKTKEVERLRSRKWIGALRESEERLRLILESVKDYAIFTIDRAGLIDSWSLGAQLVFGWGEDEIVGEPFSVIFTDEDCAAGVPEREMDTATRDECVDHERWHRRKDGTRFFASGVTTPLTDEYGHLQGFTKIARDITERMQAEEARKALLLETQAAKEIAEAANRMKDEFLATLSHELRTPLNAILGWAQLLKIGNHTEKELLEGLDTIVRNANIQTRIIEDLLDVARIISGKLRLDIQSSNLPDIIEAALDAIQPAAAAKLIQVERFFDVKVPTISVDPARLQQVVWNLVSNAVKFTPREGRIQVASRSFESSVEITVTDSGQGIKHELLPFVFDRFRQGDASTTRRHGGLGLGLAIVRQLVEMHGGTVHVMSRGESQGSTFTVQLPLKPVTIQAPAERGSSVPRTFGLFECPHAKLNGIRVLVVDDEADSRALLHRLLSQCDAEVIVAESANAALDFIKRSRPHVLVSDIGMPDRDGYDLIRELRSHTSANELPAIALTAYARPDDRKRALAAGYQMHLAKPVDSAELAAIVASLAGMTTRS